MAKLYWRVKVNGKWTWRAAKVDYYCNETYSFHVQDEFLESFEVEEE